MGAVVSNDVLLMQNGLLALRKLVKKYEYKVPPPQPSLPPSLQPARPAMASLSPVRGVYG